MTSSAKALSLEFAEYKKNPVDGFDVSLVDDDLYTWRIGIFGPPKTCYAGGYFKARLTFPKDYPYSPPSIRFETELWHPNIFKTGELCISILHPPGDDPLSGERPEERWNPTQNVRTILLSVISLLNEPNVSSPANIDASVMYMKKNDEYNKIVAEQVKKSQKEAERDGITIPTTIEEYTQRSRSQIEKEKEEVAEAIAFENDYYETSSQMDHFDYDEDDYDYDDNDDDDDDDNDDDYNNNSDSDLDTGNDINEDDDESHYTSPKGKKPIKDNLGTPSSSSSLELALKVTSASAAGDD